MTKIIKEQFKEYTETRPFEFEIQKCFGFDHYHTVRKAKTCLETTLEEYFDNYKFDTENSEDSLDEIAHLFYQNFQDQHLIYNAECYGVLSDLNITDYQDAIDTGVQPSLHSFTSFYFEQETRDTLIEYLTGLYEHFR